MGPAPTRGAGERQCVCPDHLLIRRASIQRDALPARFIPRGGVRCKTLAVSWLWGHPYDRCLIARLADHACTKGDVACSSAGSTDCTEPPTDTPPFASVLGFASRLPDGSRTNSSARNMRPRLHTSMWRKLNVTETRHHYRYCSLKVNRSI